MQQHHHRNKLIEQHVLNHHVHPSNVFLPKTPHAPLRHPQSVSFHLQLPDRFWKKLCHLRGLQIWEIYPLYRHPMNGLCASERRHD